MAALHSRVIMIPIEDNGASRATDRGAERSQLHSPIDSYDYREICAIANPLISPEIGGEGVSPSYGQFRGKSENPKG